MSEPLQLMCCVLIGYGFGCVLFAEIIGHFQSISLFEHGSGNPGMANTAKVLGKKAAAFVLAGDILKTLAAVIVCRLLFPSLGSLCALYASAGAELGHCFPFWHRFDGGKGVAVVGAAYILYSPIAGCIALACGGLCVLLKGGLKRAAALIPCVYCFLLAFRFAWISWIPAFCMGALMAWLNLRKNRLSPEAAAEDESVSDLLSVSSKS